MEFYIRHSEKVVASAAAHTVMNALLCFLVARLADEYVTQVVIIVYTEKRL